MKPLRIPEFPLTAYRISQSVSTYGYCIEAYQVELVGYNEENPAWKYRYVTDIWKSRPRTTATSTQVLEDSDFSNFFYDLYSLKVRLEQLQKEFQEKMENWLGIHQNEITSLLEKLNEHVKEGNCLRKNLYQITDTKIPEVRDLYEKVKQK